MSDDYKPSKDVLAMLQAGLDKMVAEGKVRITKNGKPERVKRSMQAYYKAKAAEQKRRAG